MSHPSNSVLVVLWMWPPESKHAGGRFWAAHGIENDGRLADWPHPPLGLIPLGAATVKVTEGEGLDLLKSAAAHREDRA